MSNFEEYKRLGESAKYEKAENWRIAIGLQQVDGLEPSSYLIELAKKNIEGELTIDEVKAFIGSYYREKPTVVTGESRVQEADIVILPEKAFTFKPVEFISIHRRLFDGVYKFAGQIRDYNISKGEWISDGETVNYAYAFDIRAALDYDFAQEKQFNYAALSKQQFIEHISNFTSNLWQIHAFGERNTRTVAVFIIKYLRTLGFVETNDMFAENSWFFRNALVRAN